MQRKIPERPSAETMQPLKPKAAKLDAMQSNSTKPNTSKPKRHANKRQ